MPTPCEHPYPEEYGASEVSWSADGLKGHVLVPCAACGETIRWEVEEA